MARQSWLESSLRHSANLGLEVLERASRRSIDWTNTGAFRNLNTPNKDSHNHTKRYYTEYSDPFANMASLMAQTTHQCKKFYDSGCCTAPTNFERKHLARFHSKHAPVKMRPTVPTKKQVSFSEGDDDFYVEVSPGTYAITASTQESQPQTQLISVSAGESINITFNL
ncbi:A-kinase-interacting protein 1 [Cynoglossus semilaevis]|uniref:A kinase (PRKA) interacting protein 1 n=1 Tax=Cynoglossus semilaevis TaxID=244447 RepID=A0A3P8UM34_CYNSE|nr:A-kinase-interacting protein 1 [Cynoglossus semilaevis]XP_008309753.1 A-kinase-interacting protein 1 [Cynoglossus semilaevis]XP_016888802.1 A-kinase-interacting protein 1 [Cynoglossus semilaevis]